MNRNYLLRNTLLITGLVGIAIILSAQVNLADNMNSNRNINKNSLADHNTDTMPPMDNTEGLSELDKIIQRYEKGDLFLSGEINYYENADSLGVPREKTIFTSINTSVVSSYEIDSVQTIMDENITLLVDKREKSIAIIERNAGLKQTAVKQNIASDLKEFKAYIYSVKAIDDKDLKKLIIQFKNDAPANTGSYEIVYEPTSYRIMKVRMEIADGEITDGNNENQNEEDELVFTDANNNEISSGYYANVKMTVYEVVYKIEKKAESGQVDIKRFVKKTAAGYVPLGLFKNYEILN